MEISDFSDCSKKDLGSACVRETIMGYTLLQPTPFFLTLLLPENCETPSVNCFIYQVLKYCVAERYLENYWS